MTRLIISSACIALAHASLLEVDSTGTIRHYEDVMLDEEEDVTLAEEEQDDEEQDEEQFGSDGEQDIKCPGCPPGVPFLHTNCRKIKYLRSDGTYIKRFAVPNTKVNWEVGWKKYRPTYHTDTKVEKNYEQTTGFVWADPHYPAPRSGSDSMKNVTTGYNQGFKQSFSICEDHAKTSTDCSIDGYQPYKFLPAKGDPANKIHAIKNVAPIIVGAPLNPYGRTGMVGRGILGKWGPNHAADTILTRFDKESGKLQFLMIQRRDTKDWALAGGMVDPGETATAAAKRELKEETGLEFKVGETVEEVGMVYRGYVDDPRNTDNSWMETSAFHYKLVPGLEEHKPEGQDDALAAGFFTFEGGEFTDFPGKSKRVYASHIHWIRQVAQYCLGPTSCSPDARQGFAQISEEEAVLKRTKESVVRDHVAEVDVEDW